MDIPAFVDFAKHVGRSAEFFVRYQNFEPKQNWDKPLLRNLKFVSAGAGKTEWEFVVTKEMCNSGGNLHGGCAATLLDDLTSACAFTEYKPGVSDAGTVSRTLTLTYLRPLPEGSKVKVFCELVSAGKSLANFKGELRNEEGKPAVTCIHDKAYARSKL